MNEYIPSQAVVIGPLFAEKRKKKTQKEQTVLISSMCGFQKTGY